MEFIDGLPLIESARSRHLDLRERLRLFAEICDAVHHAHQKGIIHRDLKPDNILVIEEPAQEPDSKSLGRPKVLDFGVARLTDSDIVATTLQTAARQIIGTLSYMSPEQVRGDYRELDTRSDIYSLGVVLCELLTQTLPYDLSRLSIAEACRTGCEDEPQRPSRIEPALRGDIETITLKALDKEKSRRYASAAALAEDIQRYLDDEPISAHPPSTFYQLRKFARRNRPLVAGIAIAFIALVAALWIAIELGLREANQARIAETNRKTALQNAELATNRANRLSVRAASSALQSHQIATAERYLDEIPSGERNWEWFHLSSLRDLRIASFEMFIDPESQVTRPAQLYGIAVDSGRGKIYWTDQIGRRIQRANLDGTNIEDLLQVATG